MTWLLLAQLILLFQSPPPPPPPPPPVPVRVRGPISQTGEGRIEGIVRRANDEDPIASARVTLSSAAAPDGTVQVLTAVSGTDGRFTFPGLPWGRYSVTAVRDGYVPRRTLSKADSVSVEVRPGAGTGFVVLPLVQSGTISGRILDPMGRPSALTTVTAARQFFENGRPALGPTRTTATDDRGEYRLFSLEPGEYVVFAEKSGSSGTLRSYFPAGDDARMALPVVVAEGAESPGTDFSLVATGGSISISGVVNVVIPAVADPKPTPRDQALPPYTQQFFLIPTEEGRLNEGILTIPNALTSPADLAAGKFELRNVRSGDYELFVVLVDRNESPARIFMAHQPIEAGITNIQNVSLTVRAGVDLSGTIRGVAGAAVPEARVVLRPRELLPNFTAVTAITRDGTFSFTNLPEFEYNIAIDPADPGFYVAELLHGRQSVLDRGVIPVANGLPDTLEVVLQAPASAIRGTVAATPSQRADGIMITLVPEESRIENLGLYKRAIAIDGTFSFDGVSPGRYLLFAWEQIPDGAEFSALFMRRFKTSGQEVVVSPGGTSSVELRLIPK